LAKLVERSTASSAVNELLLMRVLRWRA